MQYIFLLWITYKIFMTFLFNKVVMGPLQKIGIDLVEEKRKENPDFDKDKEVTIDLSESDDAGRIVRLILTSLILAAFHFVYVGHLIVYIIMETHNDVLLYILCGCAAVEMGVLTLFVSKRLREGVFLKLTNTAIIAGLSYVFYMKFMT